MDAGVVVVKSISSDMWKRLTKRVPRWIAVGAVMVGPSLSIFTRAAQDDPRLAFFEQRIRPVLVDRCYECHSTGSKKLKGGLRLDSKAGMLDGGDTKPAVVPGDSGRSLLVESMGYANPDLQMPPKGRLPDAVVADFKKWVDDGAFDPREEGSSTTPAVASKTNSSHWAFQPIKKSQPPRVAGPGTTSTNEVDQFIAARLFEHGLAMAPEAERRTLIRRAAFDLTGLPPTPDEIDTFLNDTAPDAFGRMVDRYLASPRYGERWGRWWLDVARYADTNGQDENKVMANAWRYRDWVIGSFNRNQPFDAFLTEQLAGDLLSTNGLSERQIFDRWTATGFLVLGPKMLAEQDKPKLVMDLVDEQIDVVSRAFLGLTVGCARCHDHKFDPVSAKDYYALAGIFRSTKTMANLAFVSKFNERQVSTVAELAAIEAHEKGTTALNEKLTQAVKRANEALAERWRTNLVALLAATATTNATTALLPVEQGSFPTNALERVRALRALDPATNAVAKTLRRIEADPDFRRDFAAGAMTSVTNAHGLALAPGRIGAGLRATGTNHLQMAHHPLLEPAQLTVECWVRVEEFAKGGDERRWLVAKNANEWADGHYALMLDQDRAGAYVNIGAGASNVFSLWSAKGALKPNQWHHLAMSYDGATLRLSVDGVSAGDLQVNRPRVPGSGVLAVGRRPDGYVNFKGQLDEVLIHRRALGQTELKGHFERPDSTQHADVVARWQFNDLSGTDHDALAALETRDALFGAGGILAPPKESKPLYPPTTREQITALEKERDDWKAKAPTPVAHALAVEEDKPVDLPVHIRGSHLNLAKEPVPRGFIQVAYTGEAAKPAVERSGRLELARWLTHPSNPLTSRVIVNRIWQAHFGEGLVRSSDNFGVRGDTPSHPELLDWLALEFMRLGWDVKAMHRLILSSATWRQVGGGAFAHGTPWSGSLSNGVVRWPPEAGYAARAGMADPDNRLLWHFPRLRLEAEMVRDALLAVSGRLDPAAGGSLVAWKNDEYTPTDDVSATSTRRSVYLPIVRDRVYDVFTIFDFANPSVGVAKRIPTVVSHQALFFLNSPLVKESAKALARSLAGEGKGEPSVRVDMAYRRVFGRPPTESEARRALDFLASLPASKEPDKELAALSALSQMLLAANEFIYLE